MSNKSAEKTADKVTDAMKKDAAQAVDKMAEGTLDGMSVLPAESAHEKKLKARVASLLAELSEQVQFLRNTARRVHELGAEGRNIEVDVKTRADKLGKLTAQV